MMKPTTFNVIAQYLLYLCLNADPDSPNEINDTAWRLTTLDPDRTQAVRDWLDCYESEHSDSAIDSLIEAIDPLTVDFED